MTNIVIYSDGFFLNNKLKFTKNINEVVIFNFENISHIHEDNEKLIKIKTTGNKYICDNGDNIFLTKNKSDINCIIRYNYKIFKTNYNVLCMSDNKLQTTNYKIAKKHPPSLEILDGYITELILNGITSFPSSIDLTIARKYIHKSPHTRISNLFEIDKNLFLEILKDPLIHSILKKIYYDGYHCTTYSSNILRKDVDNMFWHCDYPYHNIKEPFPKNTLGIQAIWVLDDFTEKNGSTYFVPGSHNTLVNPKINNNTDIRQAVLKKGSIILYFAKLWHTQGVNKTNNPRGSLLANFSPLEIEAKNDIASQVDANILTNNKLSF